MKLVPDRRREQVEEGADVNGVGNLSPDLEKNSVPELAKPDT
jgi:hypothetical protein